MAVELQKLLRSSGCPPGLHPSLHVYNRSSEKTKLLTEDPVLASRAVASPADLATCEIVFVMLSEDSAVQEVGAGRRVQTHPHSDLPERPARCSVGCQLDRLPLHMLAGLPASRYSWHT
jgi:hypothetical protein